VRNRGSDETPAPIGIAAVAAVSLPRLASIVRGRKVRFCRKMKRFETFLKRFGKQRNK
jgi:hypothetical protein